MIPGFLGRRRRRGSVRRVSRRVLRALRGRLRSLRRVRRARQPEPRGRGGGVPAAPRRRARQLRRAARTRRRLDPARAAPPRAGAGDRMTATPEQLMTIAGSRLLEDGKVVFAGVGSPLEASVLAKRLHAPSLTIVLEGGSIGARMVPGKLPISTNEMRAQVGADDARRDQRPVPVRAARLLRLRLHRRRARSTSSATSTRASSATRTTPRSGCPGAAARTTSSRAAARSS